MDVLKKDQPQSKIAFWSNPLGSILMNLNSCKNYFALKELGVDFQSLKESMSDEKRASLLYSKLDAFLLPLKKDSLLEDYRIEVKNNQEALWYVLELQINQASNRYESQPVFQYRINSIGASDESK